MTIDTVEQLDEVRCKYIFDTLPYKVSLEMCRDIAIAIRASDDAAGLVTIPKHPTDEMVFGAACALDRPNIYMGGPSYYNIRRAKLAYDAIIESSPFSERIDVYVD